MDAVLGALVHVAECGKYDATAFAKRVLRVLQRST